MYQFRVKYLEAENLRLREEKSKVEGDFIRFFQKAKELKSDFGLFLLKVD
jgi:predicted nuclease with TOPRIM domain